MKTHLKDIKMSSIINNQNDTLRGYFLAPQLAILDPPMEIFHREPNERRLIHLPACPASTTLIPKRDLITGEIIDYEEVSIFEAGADPNNSMSLQRLPGPLEEATRGSAMNFPFWPGGFEEPGKLLNDLKDSFKLEEEVLLTIPPGFSQGYEFENVKKFSKIDVEPVQSLNLLESLNENNELSEWFKSEEKLNEANRVEDENSSQLETIDESLLDVPKEPEILKISEHKHRFETKQQWAEVIDISQPVTDFDQRIPEPAMKFPFELDIFQKQAILKLEEHQHVFVAAHTSAGKTVVAEYAIAMSQKHMTRTVYTSPIKALSNQKYRDFKTTFKDVGLITGDLQIEPTASCLIMTTEILRSMLYCGSDCTRDLEYVIFDEVHYINNPERGHVWEEVFILLPAHVNIIMLSATVPNALDLADWVGSIKKRKVCVITTLKRPVPLEHYLYTGYDKKTRNNLFMIVDAKGNFLEENYKKAVDSYEEIEKSKMQKPKRPGAGSSSFRNVKYDKKKREVHVPKTGQENSSTELPKNKAQNTSLHELVYFLKGGNKMPVVVFTFSRKRCDENAASLNRVKLDLNTNKENDAVHMFFERCLQKLKEPDRELPQVIVMRDSLKRGIGIHHSGILPILKEIVEMLFQKGLVKLLFATETFAMGVNMPARTVVFDSHIKHDGYELRDLKPSEYIQMAGRAGRRGHDANGTVIILCRNGVSSNVNLRSIILNPAERLQSHYYLRYAMILTCQRIESIKVEDMMTHSFMEFDSRKKVPIINKRLDLLNKKLSTLDPIKANMSDLCEFHDISNNYVQTHKGILMKSNIWKELKSGQIVLISHKTYYNRLGVFLILRNLKLPLITVLILNNDDGEASNLNIDKIDDKLKWLWYRMLSLTPEKKHFMAENLSNHLIIDVPVHDIIGVTSFSFKVDAPMMLRNWNERKADGFKTIQPSSAVIEAVEYLKSLHNNYMKNGKLDFLKLSKDPSKDIELSQLEKKIRKLLPKINIVDFEKEFLNIFLVKSVENEIAELKTKLSPEKLQLYEDYSLKLKVLKALHYIDENDEVTLRGKVACEMGQNELIITELILCNIFNDLDAAEIAALLSALVFQGKSGKGNEDEEDTVKPVTERLEESQNKLKEIDEMISTKEKFYGIQELNEKSRLNFGLVDVVYEWAKKEPFSKIMQLTDFQEGIIVRCIQQLDELLRDVKTAAMRIGNPMLQSKMEEASTVIKRDIVFTASLYTTL